MHGALRSALPADPDPAPLSRPTGRSALVALLMTERVIPLAKVAAEDVLLRPVEPSDIPLFFVHASDPVALRVAAFAPAPPADLEAYRARWLRLLSSADTLVRTVVHDGNVVGHLISFPRLGRREVGGWFARASWGRGVATVSLRAFLLLDPTRPLYARAAADNLGALRVLNRCGFRGWSIERISSPSRGCSLGESSGVPDASISLSLA